MIHETSRRRGAATILSAVVIALFVACQRSPTPEAPEPAPAGPPPADEPVETLPEPAIEPEPDPAIPDQPVSGVLGNEPFVLRQADRMGTALRLSAEGDYAVTLVVFDYFQHRSWTLLDEIPFGSPHIHIRTPGAVDVVMEGYRLKLEIDENNEHGGIWLELPDGRGMIAGRFSLPPQP